MRALSLKVKFTIIALTTGLIGFGAAAFLSNEWMSRALEKHHKEQAMLVRTHIVHDLETAMAAKEHDQIPKVLEIYRQYETVEEVRIFDLRGREAFAQDQGPPEERVKDGLSSGAVTSYDKEMSGTRVTSYIIPIVNKPQCHACHGKDERLRGALLLSFSLEEMKKDIGDQRLKFMMLFAIVAMIITTVTILAVGNLFIRPLKGIQKAAEAVGKGEFKFEIPVTSQDEIGELTETFNRMSMQLKEAFESIKKSQEKMIQADKLSSLGQLSAGLAHELKNPLTSIKMILQAVLDTPSSSEPAMTKEDVQVILKEVKKLDTILTQFLTFAKPPRLQLEPLDLKDTVEEVLSLMMTEFNRNRVEIVKEMTRALPKIYGDNEKIRQVLINLFINALQAMPGGGRLEITAREMVKNHHREVLLKLEDSGEGIPEENQEKVFDPFFTTKEHGAGLGLSIVYSIIKEHHGTIDLQSQVGKGTAFMITFPVEG